MSSETWYDQSYKTQEQTWLPTDLTKLDGAGLPNTQDVICDPGGDAGKTVGRAWPGAPLEAILQFLKDGIMASCHASWTFTSHMGAVLWASCVASVHLNPTCYWSHQTWLLPWQSLRFGSSGFWQVPVLATREGPQVFRETLKARMQMLSVPSLRCPQGQHEAALLVYSIHVLLPSQRGQVSEKSGRRPWTHASVTRGGLHPAWCSNTLRSSDPVWFTLPFSAAVSSPLKSSGLI